MNEFPTIASRDLLISDLSNLGLLLFVGNLFNLFLYGALTMQFYLYYIYFPQDPWLLKTIVYLVYVTETVYTILLVYDLGHIMSRFPIGPYFPYSIVPKVTPICGAIVAFLTQAMYAHRIRALGKLKYISSCIVVLILLELIATTAMVPYLSTGLGYGVSLIFVFPDGIDFPILAWASISLVVDVMIASAMVWSLTRNKIFSKQLKSKVTRLVRLVIGTGALTVIVNLITVIFTALMSDVVCGPAILLSKLYANSMMVFLNDRASAHRGHATFDVVTVPLGSLHFETAAAPADAAQEQPSTEGRDDVGSTLRRMTNEVDPGQCGCPV